MPHDLSCEDFWDHLSIRIEMAYKDGSLYQILRPYVMEGRKTLFCHMIKLHANPQFTASGEHLLNKMYIYCSKGDEKNFNSILSIYDAQMKKFLHMRAASSRL